MAFRFRLQTLLIVFTVIVACLGANLTVQRLLGFPGGPFDTTTMALYALSHLPFYTACAIGGMIVFERRRGCMIASGIALTAIGSALTWNILAPWVELVMKNIVVKATPNTNDAVRWISVGLPLIQSIIDAICWTLMLIAFLYASAKKNPMST